MKKTIVALLVSGALVFSLAACGKKEEAPVTEPTAPTETAPAPPAEPMPNATTAAPAQ